MHSQAAAQERKNKERENKEDNKGGSAFSLVNKTSKAAAPFFTKYSQVVPD